MNAEVGTLDNKLINLPTGLNKRKTKLDNIDAGNLKTVPVNLKNLSNVVSKDIVKNTKFNKLITKVRNLGNNIPNASVLLQKNQYTTDKELGEKRGDGENKLPEVSDLVTIAVLIRKLVKLRTKDQMLVA